VFRWVVERTLAWLTGFVASPFAMNATTASITPSSRWGAR
jgi:hypothetical protein